MISNLRFLSLIIFLSLSNLSYAQKDLEYISHFSVFSSIGPQFPNGNFSKENINNGDYAQIGINTKLLDFGYNIFNNFGIKLSYFYGNNFLNSNSFLTDFVIETDVAYNMNIGYPSYEYHAPVAGLQYKIDVDNFIMLLNAMVGPFYLSTPEFTLTSGPYSLEQRTSTGSNIGYCLSAMFIKSRSNSKKNKHLTISLNYFISDIEVKGIIEDQSGTQYINDSLIGFRNFSLMFGLIRPLNFKIRYF